MLNTILPIDEIKNQFDTDLIISEHNFSKINDIAKLSPATCRDIGLSAWDKLIQLGIYKGDPMAIAKYVNNGEPRIHMKVANIIGKRIIKDIYYSAGHLEDNTLDDNQVFEFMVAHVYPNSLHLADILLQNPLQPIPEPEQNHFDQKYKGFGLLRTVMKNLEDKGKELGCDILTLTAARRDQVPLFEKYGFSVRDSDAGKLSLEYGAGLPMDKNI